MNMLSLTVRRALLLVAMVAVTLGFARTAQADTLVLMWDYNPEPEVNGYIVSIGTEPGVYSQTLDVGHTNQYVFSEAAGGQRYYFVVEAYAGDLKSPRSNEVSGVSNGYPEFVLPGNQSTAKGAAVNFALSATDPDNDPLTFSASGLPPGLMIDQRLGLITGVATTVGTYNASATVSDGKLTVGVTFVWTVTNTRPTFTAPSAQSGSVGVATSLQLQGADVNGDALTYTATGLPAGLALTPSTGRIAGTPTTAGTFTVTATVTDGLTTPRSVSFVWTISSTNAAPTLTAPGAQSGMVGQPVSLPLQASDANGDALTYSATGLPAGVQISSAGQLAGTPTTAGTYSVTVTVSDGKSSASQTFTWTIAPASVPGSLQFGAATYLVSESGTQATITITRVGGSTGTVSVAFATSNGSALAGSDYTAKTQTVSMANGVTSASVTVAILNDTTNEQAETVNLTLSSPTGGASLGSPSTAVLTITDDDVQQSGPSVTVSPATVVRGETVSATWSGIKSATSTDWLGLYVKGATNDNFVDWIYVSCSMTAATAKANGTCSLPILSILTPGTYELRVLSNDGFSSVAVSNPITVTAAAAPVLTVGATSVAPGGTVNVSWSGNAAASGTDWLALYAAGSDHGAYLAWTYVSCSKTAGSASKAGSCAVTIPSTLAAGSYEMRLFSNGQYTLLATSATFKVASPNGPALAVNASSVASGAAITATWSNVSAPSATDWLGLYAPGSDDSAYLAWNYVSCSKTAGASNSATGSCAFVIPSTLPSGSYQLRLFSNGQWTLLAASPAFTVTAPAAPSLTVTSASVTRGTAAAVSWSGIVSPTSSDWIGLYATGAADNAFAGWMYVSCSKAEGSAAAAGSCSMTIPSTVAKGTYQMRLFSSGLYWLITTSNSFTVK